MELEVLNKEISKSEKNKPILKKIDSQAAKTLSSLKEKINKKSFGRKIREKEILSFAIKLVNDEHIKELQEVTYSEHDRLYLAHHEYTKTHGKISLDQFIGKLIRGEA